MKLLAFLLLIPAIAAYSISQLVIHKKFKWMTRGFGFFGEDSYLRKYKNIHPDKTKFQVQIPKDNWYYNFFNIRYREAFFLSSTALVFVTDVYHLSQFLFLLFLSASVTFALGFTWLLLLLVWILVHIIHFLIYKLFQK